MARRRGRFSFTQWLLMGGAWLLVRILWRTRYLQPFPIGRDDGAVFVCNHRSSIDPFFSCKSVPTDRCIGWLLRSTANIHSSAGSSHNAK